MNKDRRKTLDELRERLNAAEGRFNEVKVDIESVRDEEQDTFDNMPESFQNGERGEMSQAAIDAMDEAAGHIEEIIEMLAEAANALETAAE